MLRIYKKTSSVRNRNPLENSIDCKKVILEKIGTLFSQNGAHSYNGFSSLSSLVKVIFQINDKFDEFQ